MRPDLVESPTATTSPVRYADGELLRRLLQAFWLRPENALWMWLRSEALLQCPLEHPSIDIACGEGVFSFLHCGGAFDPTFDVFTSVGDLDRVRDEHVDMFDCADGDYQPAIVSPPSRPNSIDVGTDLKTTLLAKAAALDLYGCLIQHDNNQPLPIEDDSFQTVYCNAAYWVTNTEGFLVELARITRPRGRIVLQVKLECMRGYTLTPHREVLGDRLLNIIGRD